MKIYFTFEVWFSKDNLCFKIANIF